MVQTGSSTVAELLADARNGDRRAASRIWDLVYAELRRMARRRYRSLPPGQTLQATALVHETYLKLSREGRFDWQDLREIYSAAARAMRDILVDAARRKSRLKRAASARRVPLSDTLLLTEKADAELLGLDAALPRLERTQPRAFEVVLLRFFAGLTSERTARALGISSTTAERDWRFAKAWLYRELSRQAGGPA